MYYKVDKLLGNNVTPMLPSPPSPIDPYMFSLYPRRTAVRGVEMSIFCIKYCWMKVVAVRPNLYPPLNCFEDVFSISRQFISAHQTTLIVPSPPQTALQCIYFCEPVRKPPTLFPHLCGHKTKQKVFLYSFFRRFWRFYSGVQNIYFCQGSRTGSQRNHPLLGENFCKN